jgi:hypothetical protein
LATQAAKCNGCDLSGSWNALDQCPYTGVYQGTEECQEYLREMNQKLCQGVAKYENPFGVDDCESFDKIFLKTLSQDLTKNEK